MKHIASTFYKKLKRPFRHIFPLLIVVLLCVVLFGCTDLTVSEKMDYLASLVLKFSLAYCSFALAQYFFSLIRSKKNEVNKPTLKRKKKNNTTPYLAPSIKKEQQNIDDICLKRDEFFIRKAADNFSLPQYSTQTISGQPFQPEEENLISSTIFFGAFDDREMIAELEGEPRTTHLKIDSKGELVGYKLQDGVYQIFPRAIHLSEQDVKYSSIIPQVIYLNEQDVKYSPLPICFEINEVIPVKKTNKVEITQSATLIESEKMPGLYMVYQKGKLNIIP